MKFLKKASERAKKVGGIKDLINREVGGYESARSGKKIHASDLTRPDPEYCPRQIRLMELLDKKPRDHWIPGVLRMTFDEGTWKQWQINNVYLQKYMAGYWLGDSGFAAPWSVGPPSETVAHTYQEPFFKDPLSEAQGSIDGLVKLPGKEKLRVMECKIIATSMFKDSNHPNHRFASSAESCRTTTKRCR